MNRLVAYIIGERRSAESSGFRYAIVFLNVALNSLDIPDY